MLFFGSNLVCLWFLQKQGRPSSQEDAAEHALSQEFIEQQRAYFAEIDAFELPEEEVQSVAELD